MLCVAICICSCQQKTDKSESNVAQAESDILHAIIPQPFQFSRSTHKDFSFENGVIISASDELSSEKKYLEKYLSDFTRISNSNSAAISLKVWNKMPEHSHKILCMDDSISITGGSAEAVFNGINTLKQCISINRSDAAPRSIQAFTISDHPKFKWRGMLLDCCRHYFPKEVILKYIDLLAYYKLNILHWHITEDQAWRIAIDAYPKLTEIGAWREDILAKMDELYGGFYSKEDIAEIVKYASERHVQIVPEIEMPGHSSAAVAAYPELGCTGEQISVPNDWGVFKDIYCPTENTFTFLETVLDEVCEMFPSNYVHIGGDEAPKTRWEESEFCQNLLQKEGLKDYEEMQSYFINRIATYLNGKGKTIIGWDEILNDELTETAIIQSWRGMDGGKKAVSEGRNAIMSPTSHCYLDYSLKAIDTEKIYGFNPIPPDCSTEETGRILGAECNMWTEHVPDEKTLDSKVFPRLIAASEAFWGTNTDYSSFTSRLDMHYPMLEDMNVTYGNETVAISIQTQTVKDQISVTVKENLRDPETIYSFKKTVETKDKPILFKGELIKIPKNQKSQLYIGSGIKNSKLENRESITISFDHHNWLSSHIDYSVPFSDYYTAGGEKGLTDGVLGSLDFRDGHWQGFFGEDIELIIQNPNEDKTISSVSMNFYRYINSWIFPPESVEISVSKDGKNWTKTGSISNSDNEMHVRGKKILSTDFTFESTSAHFLKITIKNIGKVPHWHEASGEPAWVFIDEVAVR